MGMGTKKTWDAITNQGFQMELSTGKWTEVRSVPGVAGRLAASAAALRDQIILMADTWSTAKAANDCPPT